MRLLALDTCCGLCSIAVFENGQLVSNGKSDNLNMQAEELLPMLENSLTESKLEYKDFDAIGITVGPGSFTGIRVGMSAAYAINSITKVPIIGVTTTELLASLFFDVKGPICVTLAAGRGRFYCQNFATKDDELFSPCAEITLLEPEEVKSFAEGAKIVGNYVDPELRVDAVDIGKFIHIKYDLDKIGGMDISELPNPIYGTQGNY